MENEDNNVELKDLKKVEEGPDEVDKSEEKSQLMETEENIDKKSETSSNSSSDNARETCTKIWETAFNKLAKADGDNDGQIEMKSLVKWIVSLDLNSKIEFEKNLEISPKRIERIVKKVS